MRHLGVVQTELPLDSPDELPPLRLTVILWLDLLPLTFVWFCKLSRPLAVAPAPVSSEFCVLELISPFLDSLSARSSLLTVSFPLAQNWTRDIKVTLRFALPLRLRPGTGQFRLHKQFLSCFLPSWAPWWLGSFFLPVIPTSLELLLFSWPLQVLCAGDAHKRIHFTTPVDSFTGLLMVIESFLVLSTVYLLVTVTFSIYPSHSLMRHWPQTRELHKSQCCQAMGMTPCNVL